MILFIVVLYKCKYELSRTYRTLLSYVDSNDVFIFDNSPVGQTISDGSHYTHCPENKGLSYAYNQASQYAKTKGYSWLLILDQDTSFPDDALVRYKNAILDNPDIQLFVPKHRIASGLYMSPVRFKFKRGSLQKCVPEGRVRVLPYAPINSGMLVALEAFEKAGGYEDNVYLDFSDICFVEKFARLYSQFYVLNIECIQDFSEEEVNVASLLKRFDIYCECATNYPRMSLLDSVSLFYTVTRHCLHLFIKTRETEFFRVYIANYLLR